MQMVGPFASIAGTNMNLDRIGTMPIADGCKHLLAHYHLCKRHQTDSVR